MWDFFETVRHRHSVRKYQSERPIEAEKLHAILEMACAAPSAGDLQAYQVIVVQDPAVRRALSAASEGQDFIAQAPVCLAFCSAPERAAERFGARGRDLYALQDATIAASYAQLAIVAAGMASTWIGYFDDAKVKQALELEPGLIPVALLAVGYPAELPEPSPRRRLDAMVRYL